MREGAAAKGRRYVTEGRLLVLRVDGLTVEARCRGVGEVYSLGHNGGGWWCECPARGRCAHLEALMLVTVRRRVRLAV